MKFAEWIKPNRRFKTGTAVMATIAVVIALAVAANLLVGALPESITKKDITQSGLYTLGESSQTVANSLESEVEIYYLVQDGAQDAAVETLLDRYAEQSSKISWQIKDPAVYPTFAHNYDDAAEGSLIVTCGDKYQVIDSYDLYAYNYDSTTGGYTTDFDAENQITSALRYVSSTETPMVYLMKGHNETTLPSSLSDQMKQQNLTSEEINLLNYEAVPEDAAAVMILEPQKDLTEHETQLLNDYLANGGKLLLFSSLTETDMPNLDAILAAYGMSRSGGLIVETDSSKIYGGYPTVMLPSIAVNSMTQGADTDGYVLLKNAGGIQLAEEMPEGVSVVKLLTTSDNAISKTNWQQMSTWELEEGDLQGQFALGASAEKTTDDITSGIVWFSSSTLLDDNVDMMVNGNNSALVLSALAQLAGQEVESLGIAAKSLTADYLVVPTEDASRWNMISMYLLPAAALIAGIAITVTRRKA